VQQVLGEFLTPTDSGWQHSRCEAELASFREKQALRNKGGTAAKLRRAAQLAPANSGAGAVLEHGASAATQEPITKDQEPDLLTTPNGVVVPGPWTPARCPCLRTMTCRQHRNCPPRQEDDLRPPKCPHEDIIALYQDILPVRRPVHRRIDKRWNEDKEHQNLTSGTASFTTLPPASSWPGALLRNNDERGPPSVTPAPFYRDVASERCLRLHTFVPTYKLPYSKKPHLAWLHFLLVS
jgi:hypothetical protein